MQRLRHPIRAIREPFGKAGLTVAILALVLAMVGGAWAAGALTAKQKKEVKAIAKKFAGKPGATGPTGPTGANGTNGKDGANGAPGKDGQSVTGTTASAGECPAGGVKYTSASGANAVCNGENGETGFTETLPSGKTETGTWSARLEAAGGVWSPISFTIPLAAAPTATFITKAEQESHTAPTECSGTAEEPSADPGNLCVYEGASAGSSVGFLGFANPASNSIFTEGASPFGTIATFECSGFCLDKGTWAATAP